MSGPTGTPWAKLNLEPAVRLFLDRVAASGQPPLHAGTPQQARETLRALVRMPPADGMFGDISDHSIVMQGRRIEARLHVPAGDPASACLVFLHGGGWVLGALDESELFVRELATATRCAVLSVGYRLAPEFPFPAAVDDSYAALEWIEARCEQLLGARLPLIVIGASAGANLAAVITNLSLARSGPHVTAQILAYPITDSAMDTPSYAAFADGPLLDRAAMAWFWDQYIGAASDRSDPRASPLRADLSPDAPPSFILTAENDPLRDEGEAYADALRRAGCDVEAKRYAGQIHGFVTMVGLSAGYSQALTDIALFVARQIGPKGQT